MASTIFSMIKLYIYRLSRPRGKYSFLSSINTPAKVIDIGCGKTPNRIKPHFPDLLYTGIDIDDHFEKKNNLADKYILTTPDNFVSEVRKQENNFDATISSHNLEHCEDRVEALNATLDTVKIGGMLYLSFPSEESVNFPHRPVTLNYFDDSTHKLNPPIFSEVIAILEQKGFEVIFKTKKYRPILLRILGFLIEPLSRVKGKVYTGTWELYGFETIIWAKKFK